jgi:myo-inositol-1(or 4)-monophosphatase
MVDADGWLIEELTALAVLLAVQATELVVARSGRPIRIRTKISGRDLASDTDLAVERLLVEAITAGRPDDAVLTEETGVHGGSGPVRWLLDPIDGTTNFVHGLPGFVVSIAAQVAGRTVVAAIRDPVHHKTFVASLGGTARPSRG